MDEDRYDARVKQTFVDPDGRLSAIPVQRKKRVAILRWLVEDFQPGRLYREADVNEIIARRHPDFAALRRYLVDEELMQRGVACTGAPAACRTWAGILRSGPRD